MWYIPKKQVRSEYDVSFYELDLLSLNSGTILTELLVSPKQLGSILMRMMNRIRRQHNSQQIVTNHQRITDGVPLFAQAVIKALLQGSMGFGLGSSRSLAF